MKAKLFVLLLMGCSMAVEAQEVLTVTRCRELALQNNHEIRAAQAQTESAQYIHKSYRANFFPSINVNMLGLVSNFKDERELQVPSNYEMPVMKPGADFKQQAFDPSNGSDFASKLAGYLYFPGLPVPVTCELGPAFWLGVSLEQPIFMGGKIVNASKMSRLAVEMSAENENLVKTNVIKAADEAFALVVHAKEMRKVAEAYNQVLTDLMNNVIKAKNQGMKTGNDVLKVQVKFNESELALQKAENGIVLAKMNLCHLLGMSLRSDIDVDGGYPQVDVVSGGVGQRSETLLLNKKVEIAEAKTKVERSAMLPEVGAQLSYNHLEGLEINDKKIFDQGSMMAVVKVKVPICSFGKNLNKVRASKSALEQTRLEQQNLVGKMELEQQRAANYLSEAEKEVVVADKSLEQAAENMRASRSMYANGFETLTDCMEAQVLWQKAMAAKVDADYRLYLSKVELNRTSGTLLKQ